VATISTVYASTISGDIPRIVVVQTNWVMRPAPATREPAPSWPSSVRDSDLPYQRPAPREC
jgi:hypothetical protein